MGFEVQGFVEQIGERRVTTKFGESTAYSIKIRSENGETEWYGLGFKKPPFREGSSIKFEAYKNKKGYLDADFDSFEVLKDVPASTASSGSNSGTKALNNRDNSITLQTAFKVAPEIVNGMIAAGILSLASGTKASKENSQEAYLEYVNRVAYDLQAKFLDPDAHRPGVQELDEDEEHGEFDD